jgi:hypothetical protein
VDRSSDEQAFDPFDIGESICLRSDFTNLNFSSIPGEDGYRSLVRVCSARGGPQKPPEHCKRGDEAS